MLALIGIVCIGTLYLLTGMLTVYLVNGGTQMFTYADYISFAAATVWAGKADLPSTIELWRRQHDRSFKLKIEVDTERFSIPGC